MKECFLYDQHNRLVRAHTTTGTGSCATTTSSATTSTGTLDAYDLVWAFDDIHRITSRTDKLTSVATTFGYAGSKHAVTSLSGGSTASYGYNAAGAMTSRAGTSMGYDTMQRLTGYGSSEQYLYGVSNQRLMRTVGTTRTLYLPGMEVVDTAGTVTLTKWLTIGGTTVGTKSMAAGGGSASVAWNCGSLQNSVVCQAPAGAPNVYPARKRYKPYGDDRNTVTFANTDHGFLNQPEDASGLTYLNNRCYDPSIGSFTSVDPLVGNTGTPYLYANGNPPTLSDPSGLWTDPCGNLGAPPSGTDPCRTAQTGPQPDPEPAPASTCPPKCGGAPKPTSPKGPNLPGSSGPSAPVEPTEGAGGGPVNSQQYAQYNREVCEYFGCTPPDSWMSDALWTMWDGLTSERFVSILKNIGVAVVAVAGGVLICGASAGVGCVVIAAAVVGAGTNMVAEEGMDCLYRTCGDWSYSEAGGDALQGALLGGTSGFFNVRLAQYLGAPKVAIGLLGAVQQYGVSATAGALVEQSVPRGIAWFIKFAMEQGYGGD